MPKTKTKAPAARVLVVDDAQELTDLLESVLGKAGYETATAVTGDDAITLAMEFEPDVVLLDIGLPGRIDGIEVCRRIRAFSDTYIVMLTARNAEVDRVTGLEVGADDYVTKPFSPRELLARVRAMQRRPRTGGPATANERIVGDLVIDPVGRTVHRDGEELSLTRIEFSLLEALSSNPDMVLTRQMLRDRVWGPAWYGDDHVVDVHIANLRKKLDLPEEASHIRTVRGVGYRMRA